jgi:hypothetical protein
MSGGGGGSFDAQYSSSTESAMSDVEPIKGNLSLFRGQSEDLRLLYFQPPNYNVKQAPLSLEDF